MDRASSDSNHVLQPVVQ
uniref:Uncharacterized protein n=1 Tax=Arundo donax TaxID=35708 RepID=A0A0A8YWU1_ARUDO